MKDNKEKRNRRIFDLWLACWTQAEIAAEVDTPAGTVKRLLGDGDDSLVRKVLENQTNQAAAEHANDFEAPLYNVWKQQSKSAGAEHFGNSEPRWLDNLLYLYTQPFDVVVDPFAGGGSNGERRVKPVPPGNRLFLPAARTPRAGSACTKKPPAGENRRGAMPAATTGSLSRRPASPAPAARRRRAM